MTPADMLRDDLGRVQRIALIVGGVAFVVFIIGALFGAAQFFRSYLVAYIFWTGIAVGCLALAMLNHLVRGRWRVVTAPFFESGSRTLPLMALLFLPFIAGMPYLYEWARPEAVEENEILQSKVLYLNVPFFWLRALIYFVAWLLFMFFMNRLSLRQTREGGDRLARPLRMISAGGLVVFGLTITFAAFDWIMSIEPEWYSTIFGAIVGIGAVLAAFAFVVALAGLLSSRAPIAGVLTRELSIDLGSLMLAFLMLWAYFSFSQYMLIWSANIQEELPWYLTRLSNGWEWIPIVLIVFHFVVPFFCLISREFKSNARALARLALLLLFMRLLEVFWLISPTFHRAGIYVHWLDIAAVVAIGGVWFAFFLFQVRRGPYLAAFEAAAASEEAAHG